VTWAESMGCGLRKSGGSTVDLTVAGGRSSPELGLAAALGHGDLLRRHERKKGRCGDPSGGLTLGGEAVRWASGGGEQSAVATLGV
jgi:hypothetical protein